MDIERFIRAYMVCALWSSHDETGEDLDAVFTPDDFSPDCSSAMRATCRDFCEANAADLALLCEEMARRGGNGADSAGHDFWLTRCGHGAGFWDRGLGELGERLSKAAEVYGNVDLYAGDDGLIYGETE